jgi:hypothetical protein
MRWTHRWTCAIGVALGLVGASGCFGPTAVRYTRMRYNEVVRDTNDQQLLLNIVRLRYADSPIFIDLPNITSQFEIQGTGGYLGGYGNQYKGPTSLGSGLMSLRDTPTLSYHPREGREIAKALLTPITGELFIVVNAGADVEQLLFLAMNDINDVNNAARATTLTPTVPDHNVEFMRGVRLLADLRARDATELAFATDEETEGASEPISKGSVLGKDLLSAAKDGYVYRAAGDGQVRLIKRDKELVLKIHAGYVDSPEMAEVARIFHLTPGRDMYKLKSELADVTNLTKVRLPTALGNDTLYMNLRSILQVMTFLSKGVCLPDEHVARGIAPSTPRPDGLPFDWTEVTAGHFAVRCQKHRPKDAEVAVPYRGYWFYIADNDVASRASLAILEVLFALQESDGKSAGPLLTLPLGG